MGFILIVPRFDSPTELGYVWDYSCSVNVMFGLELSCCWVGAGVRVMVEVRVTIWLWLG